MSSTPTPTPTPITGNPFVVKVFWLIPDDVHYDENMYVNINIGMGRVMLEAQNYYQQELGVTFKLNIPIVEVVDGDHPTNWYETTPINGQEQKWWAGYNMRDEIMRKYNIAAPDPRWKVVSYISAQGHGGEIDGWVMLPKGDVEGAGGYSDEPMDRWVGGMVHELGHAFGLPDIYSSDGTPMSSSFYNYPDCHFSPEQKEILLNNIINHYGEAGGGGW
jgi:hypothetical protein